MPIYEYRCGACARITSAIILKPQEEEALRCAHCGQPRLQRVLSRFSVHKTEAQRLAEFDTRAPRDDSFYKDSRNIGLWAKKRAQELGADLGPQFEEVVERGRTGKILEDYGL
ncbi:MAG: FmdB family zinc ribbon protein [Thermodesulfobacteriota bacterium]